jgi:U-box domain
MGTCRGGGGYRGYLSRLNQASSSEKKEAFACIKKGNITRIAELIIKYPGLLNQAADEPHKSNIIISILYQIANSGSSDNLKKSLLQLLQSILRNHKERIDLAFKDNEGNTALHRVFWYAIKITDSNLSAELAEIGCQFLSLIKDSAEFRKIMAIKNNHNESFLHNIYIKQGLVDNINDRRVRDLVQKNVLSVQEKVAHYIDPYKVRRTDQTSPVDFKEKSFKARLEELLTDPITYSLMETPVIFTTEGHTLDRTTWDNLRPKQNPLTRTEFTEQQLSANQTVDDIIELFKLYGCKLTRRSDAPTEDYYKNLIRDRYFITNEQLYYFDAAKQSLEIVTFLNGKSLSDLMSKLSFIGERSATEEELELIRSYTGHTPTNHEKELAEAIQNYFGVESRPSPADVTQQFNAPDLLTRDIQDLVRAYLKSLQPVQINQQPQPGEMSSSAPTHFTSGDNLAHDESDMSDEDENKTIVSSHVNEDGTTVVSPVDEDNTTTVTPHLGGPVVFNELPPRDKIIIEIINELTTNIDKQKNGRATWFKQNVNDKLMKLRAIFLWINFNRLDDNNEPIILAIIRDVCAIKRNKLGFFAPHSLDEFKEMVGKQHLNCCNAIHFTDKDLIKLNSIDGVKSLVEDGKAQISRIPGLS